MSSVKRKEVGSHLEQANMETFLQTVLYFVNVKQIIKVLRLLFLPPQNLVSSSLLSVSWSQNRNDCHQVYGYQKNKDKYKVLKPKRLPEIRPSSLLLSPVNAILTLEKVG